MAAKEFICFSLCMQAARGLRSPANLKPSQLFEHSPPDLQITQLFSEIGVPIHFAKCHVPGRFTHHQARTCRGLKGRLACKRPSITKQFFL
jgi:hypothetical protein